MWQLGRRAGHGREAGMTASLQGASLPCLVRARVVSVYREMRAGWRLGVWKHGRYLPLSSRWSSSLSAKLIAGMPILRLRTLAQILSHGHYTSVLHACLDWVHGCPAAGPRTIWSGESMHVLMAVCTYTTQRTTLCT